MNISSCIIVPFKDQGGQKQAIAKGDPGCQYACKQVTLPLMELQSKEDKLVIT